MLRCKTCLEPVILDKLFDTSADTIYFRHAEPRHLSLGGQFDCSYNTRYLSLSEDSVDTKDLEFIFTNIYLDTFSTEIV